MSDADERAECGRAVKQGAVLYDTRGNTSLDPVSDRALCHVVSVFEEVGTGDRLYNVWDGTHTYQEFVHEDRLLEDFELAGWTFPRGSKPLYHLTRNCGVEDPADLMTDGGTDSPTIPPYIDPNTDVVECHFCGRQWNPTVVDGFDLSAEDEYYPNMVPVCPEHAEGCR